MDSNEKTISKIREDTSTKPIEANIESTGVAQEEPVFFDNTDPHETKKKNAGSLKTKRETLHLTIHQSSPCRVITQMTYTKIQQL